MFAVERYRRAESVADAVRLLAEDPFSIPIAGGTDILVKLREGHRQYANLVDVHGLAELESIILDTDGTLCVGAGATFTQVMESPLVREHAPVLAEGASWVAGPQIRNVGTIGGNICNGSVCADSVPPLLVLDAELELAGPEGLRRTPLRGFHTGPGIVARGQAEVLTKVLVPAPPRGAFAAASLKYAMRRAMDITTIGCAASVLLDGESIVWLKLAFSVAAPTPVRCPSAEAAASGKPLTAQTVEAVKKTVEVDVAPRTSWRAPADFRMHIIRELSERAMRTAVQRAGGGIR
ncbi:MAG: xanthine dehydrogenase FAD-binding subunit XdhB [Desulfovibrio sp.]|nr:xanthine dehydrogenase FAD-binding subunit XdhB [Desulfovibrio sp.]